MTTWNLDVTHSSAQFSVKHLGITPFRARFKTLEGEVQFDDANPEASTVVAKIDSNSLDLNGERFLGHVVGVDFLETDVYPSIDFVSTKVDVSGDKWTITGDLTIKGVTKEVVLDAEYLGQAKHPMAPRIFAAWTAKTQFKRSDFGMSWNFPMEGGGFYVGDDINVNLVIEAARPVDAA